MSNLTTLTMIGFGLLILVAPTSVPGLTPPVSMRDTLIARPTNLF